MKYSSVILLLVGANAIKVKDLDLDIGQNIDKALN